MHNLLLDIDRLDKEWENGIPSCWEEMNNNYNERNVKMNTPFAISKLNRCYSQCEKVLYDKLQKRKKISPKKLNHSNHISWDKYTVNGKGIVSKMPLFVFQKRLVEHFDIRFKQNVIVWPCRIKKINGNVIIHNRP